MRREQKDEGKQKGCEFERSQKHDGAHEAALW